MSTEPPPPVPPLPILQPRTGRGCVWSDIVAEIERDDAERQERPPAQIREWTPEPVIRTTPAGDTIQAQPADLGWAC